MAARETELLENALDALDRLFDNKSSVIDVQALFIATGEALRSTAHHAAFESPIAELESIVRSGMDAVHQRDRALEATEQLRHYLADWLSVEP